jgi:hypothetical protein
MEQRGRRFVMKKAHLSVIGILALVLVLLVAAGCVPFGPRVRVGELQTESKTVELGGAGSVRIDINMGAGELKVAGGAAELLEADFTYNVAELKPEVEFSGGTLVVKQPDIDRLPSFSDLDEYRYEWDLRLNDDVPMDMRINVGAGRTDLKLGSLSLTGLDVKGGAGDIRVDLAGAASLTRLDVTMGAGEVTVDLTGDWQTDLDAEINGGAGAMTVRLPRAVGVRVDVERGVGKVNASGMRLEGDDYVNDAYGESEVTLRIKIQAGVGEINLQLGE